MAIDYIDLTGPDGSSDNIGGMTQRGWVISKSALATIATASDLSDDTVTDQAQYATVAGDHVPISGEGFILLYNHMDKGSFEASSQGEIGGRSYKMVGKGFYPGMDPEVLGFFRKAKNDQFIVLMEMLDGTIVQLGSDRLSAYITGTKVGTGTNSSGIRGTDYEIDSMESGPVLYEGAITLHP